MIIVRTPLRVSLFGGGSDIPAHYERHGGAVLGFALNHYVYLTVRRLPPFHEHRVRVVYSRVELAEHAANIAHPGARAVLTELGFHDGVEVTYAADLPARAGLGSSSAFIVGLIHALRHLDGNAHVHPAALAREAIRIERGVMGETGGVQDQLFAAHGGMLSMTFARDRTDVERLPLPNARLAALLDHLLLAFTGEVRDAPTISASLDLDPIILTQMANLAREARWLLIDDRQPLDGIGGLLHEAWGMKRRLSPLVSTPRVDDAYARARAAGAIGGKLLGAGGGGFLLLFARPADHDRIRAALPDLVFVPVGVDRDGSKIFVNGQI